MKKKKISLSGKVSRREAIGKGLVAAGVVLTTNLTADAQQRPNRQNESIAHLLSEDHWANLVEHQFNVVGMSFDETNTPFQPTSITLMETEKLKVFADDARPRNLKPHATSLIFRGPREFKFLDACYSLNHRWLGKFDLLLSYTKLDKYPNDNIYNAILNS
jgi:hypothetical protein